MKKQYRTVKMPPMTRTAHIVPKTLDKKKRTVEVIFTKGTRILRHGFFETFFEELGLQKENVRMGRLESGNSPVLDNHGFTDKSGVRSTIGVVENATLIEGKEGRATLRFSKRDEVTPIFQDIEDGILRNVSVGYTTFRFEKVGEDNEIPIFRAIDWEPAEISVVPAGADPDAVIRSKNGPMTECVLVEEVEDDTDPKPDEVRSKEPTEPADPKKIVELKDEPLDNPKNLRQTKVTDGGIEAMDPKELAKIKEEARKQGIADENKRQTEIRSIVKKVGFEDSVAGEYIESEKSIDEVRTLVIDKLAEKDKKPEGQTRSINIEIGKDNAREARLLGMESALLHRFRPTDLETRHQGKKMILPGYKLEDQAKPYAFRSLADLARISLEEQGIRTSMLPNHAIVDLAMNNGTRSTLSTSDFPEILANVINKTLRGGYLAAPQTWKPFTSEVFVSDFKQISRTNLGDAEKLELLQEGSEIKRGAISEDAEKYQVEEYAKIMTMSRKMIINDDLAAFTRLPERMGRRAADLESDTVWDIVKDNANLSDGNALFSSQHGNLDGSPGAPSEGGLTTLRTSMRRQTGLDGAEISLTPVWVFVPPAHETAMEKLLAATRPTQPTEVNPFGPNGRTTLIMDVEPRLETGASGSLTAWFGTADKGQIDMIELARLEGTNGPQLQSRDGFDVNGMEIKIMHDIGAKAIDFRGLFKNAGA